MNTAIKSFNYLNKKHDEWTLLKQGLDFVHKKVSKERLQYVDEIQNVPFFCC